MTKQKLVVLTGAGISAESGIKTFRDSNGLWENHSIEEVATLDAWHKNPALVLEFYNQRRQQVKDAKPNAAHIALAELESLYDVHIVTQNIDDLHERAGSVNVMHLHGEIFKMCSENDKSIQSRIEGDIKIGDKAKDGHQQRPFIVWFGEAVPMLEDAILLMQSADIFLLAGSSLAVYPAAGLIDHVPDFTPKYVIDPKIPAMRKYHNLTCIETSATDGMQILLNQHFLKDV